MEEQQKELELRQLEEIEEDQNITITIVEDKSKMKSAYRKEESRSPSKVSNSSNRGLSSRNLNQFNAQKKPSSNIGFTPNRRSELAQPEHNLKISKLMSHDDSPPYNFEGAAFNEGERRASKGSKKKKRTQ